MTSTDAKPAAPSRAHTITGDLACIGCAYNLRGLRSDGDCTECGAAIRRSARRDRYRRHITPLRWLAIVTGALLIQHLLTGWLWYDYLFHFLGQARRNGYTYIDPVVWKVKALGITYAIVVLLVARLFSLNQSQRLRIGRALWWVLPFALLPLALVYVWEWTWPRFRYASYDQTLAMVRTVLFVPQVLLFAHLLRSRRITFTRPTNRQRHLCRIFGSTWLIVLYIQLAFEYGLYFDLDIYLRLSVSLFIPAWIAILAILATQTFTLCRLYRNRAQGLPR